MRIALPTLLLLAAQAQAQIEWRGFAEYAAASQTVEDGVLPLHELRLQLAGDYYGDRSEAHFALDLIADRVRDEETPELREAFARMDLFDRRAELRVGRQPMTWGTGDLIFLNDVFPKDYESFFTGRDDVYLKRPVDGARLTVFSGGNTLDLVLIPQLTPDRLPTADRFGLDTLTMPPITEPEASPSEVNLAARLSRPLGNWNAALYLADGRMGQPMGFADGQLFYPERTLLGASMRGTLRGGVAWLEGGREWVDEDDAAMLPGDLWSAFGGYERTLWSDATGNLQAQWSEREDTDTHWLLTTRFEQLMWSQTLRLSSFLFYSPTDEDGLLRLSAAYDLEDGLRLTLGANLFAGEETDTQFGRLGDADVVYFRARRMF